jgi:hypothetical protein
MGRPTVIDDQTAEAIAYVARPGMSSRKIEALLAEAGIRVSHATIARYMRQRREIGAPAPLPPDATPADELTGLEAQLASVDAALAQWQPTMGSDKSAVLAFARLVEVKKGVLRAIDELRPRASAEAERLMALGDAAKAELLERARVAARLDEGLRAKVARQRELLDARAAAIATVDT